MPRGAAASPQAWPEGPYNDGFSGGAGLRVPWRILAVTAVVGGSAATLVHAQIARFSAQASMVLLSATALDKNGRPVTDLKPNEVRILEDGRLQKIEHFAQAQTSPLRILFLADASSSMSASLKTTSTRMALVQLLASLGPEDQAAL